MPVGIPPNNPKCYLVSNHKSNRRRHFSVKGVYTFIVYAVANIASYITETSLGNNDPHAKGESSHALSNSCCYPAIKRAALK
jgi:hypothetical protein